ncbi:MAG TPA: hypothetical protein VLG76_07200 [Rhabdochlamydiaceae bacterium]|nr:hypothetical protein [Rhabdochlamydiaceae bacterium]
MKLKKHPFILLELLIAIALVSFTTLPFVHYPFIYLNDEVDSLVRMELERAAEVALIETKADLYQNLIPWEVLTRNGSTSVPDIEKKIHISLPHNIEKTYIQRVYFSLSKQKKGQGEEELFLIHVKTTFDPPKKKRAVLTINREILIKQMPKTI